MRKKMSEKSKTPILDFYQSLGDEPRGTKSQFMLWLQLQTRMSDGGLRTRLRNEDWSPIERDAIMKAISDGSWRECR